jgi:hypothetical protein
MDNIRMLIEVIERRERPRKFGYRALCQNEAHLRNHRHYGPQGSIAVNSTTQSTGEAITDLVCEDCLRAAKANPEYAVTDGVECAS